MTSTTWQLAADSALRYQQILVPSILGPAARVVVERAPVQASRRIADLGCGTGAAIHFAGRLADGTAELIGIDNNQAMLAVCRAAGSGSGRPVRHIAGNLLALPLCDASCDLVLCAQTLQFVGDYAMAAAEMHRILGRHGSAVIGLWCPESENPYFASLARAIEIHIGAAAAAGLKAIFNLSDPRAVVPILEAAGFRDISADAIDVKPDLGDLAGFIPRHIAATPIAAAFAAANDAARSGVVDHMVDEIGPVIGRDDGPALFRTWVFVARR